MENNLNNFDFKTINIIDNTQAKKGIAAVFAWMFVGMILTTVASLSFAFVPELLKTMLVIDESTGQIIGKSMLGHLVTFAPLILLIVIGAASSRMSFKGLAALFIAFTVLFGTSISFIFFIYNIGTIVNVFLSTCALFGVMAAMGYFTKTDLTKMGNLLGVAVIGIFIASLINLFMKSDQMGYIISVIAVVIFTGLTAYDMQKIKNMMVAYDGSDDFKKVTLFGALSLYLDFVNLFLSLLRVFGGNKD